jgi:hypothetical protein
MSRAFPFRPQNAYIARFAIRDFEKDLESLNAAKRKLIAKDALPGAMSADVDFYDVSMVSMQKVPVGTVIQNNETSDITANARTWIFDIVFIPNSSQSAWVDMFKWRDHIAANLRTVVTYRPRVTYVGLVTCDPSEYCIRDVCKYYKNLGNQLLQLPRVLRVDRGKVALTESGKSQFQEGLLGPNGSGFVEGLSDVPSTWKPISFLERREPVAPGVPGEPGAPVTDEDKQKRRNRYLAAAVFGVLGFLTYQRVARM